MEQITENTSQSAQPASPALSAQPQRGQRLLWRFLTRSTCFHSTWLPSSPSSDVAPRSLPARRRDPGTKCSRAYQTASLHSGDNQSEFIAPWNLTHPPTGWLIFMSFGCFSLSQAIILQINQWLSLPPPSILCGSLLARPAVQLQMLRGS